MKKFKLDLSKYDVTTRTTESNIIESVEYPLRQNLSSWLRSPGVFKNGNSIAEAVVLAKSIREHEGDEMILDEQEAALLKECLNRFIAATAEGNSTVGGEVHEEAICRVFTMQEVK
jgi:hypothetical protein